MSAHGHVHACMPGSKYNLFGHVEMHGLPAAQCPWPLAGIDRTLLIQHIWLLVQDESIMRKKYFNQMEDMKGKIRVYARVRPMLGFEAERGQKARHPHS